ncbi:MAG: methyltransferase domain-containing protein [Myxococcota bacterium]
MPIRYTHGHHESVLRSHRWRTAENSAAHLLPHLRKGQELLDVGCGPGTITFDLARRVAPGRVVGIDVAHEVVAAAAESARAEGGVTGVTFAVDDVYALDRKDGSFDVVHAHQLLQHPSDPVAALREMRRVLRPGGLLALRDSDYGAFAWAPRDAMLDRWNDLHHRVTRANDAEADAGRFLLAWVKTAGFEEVTPTSSTWTFATPDDRRWWGDGWADRVEHSSFATQAVEYGLSDAVELASIADAWRRWAAAEDAVFIVVHGEIIARR